MRKLFLIAVCIVSVLILSSCGNSNILDEGKAVETKLIATYERDRDEAEIYDDFLDMMVTSDAQYFYIDGEGNTTPEGINEPFTLYQTDRMTVDEIASKGLSVDKAAKIMISEIEDFYNQSYEKITHGKQKGSTLYNNYYLNANFANENETYCVYDYYKNNNLIISGDNWTFKKVAVHLYSDDDAGTMYKYLFVIEGDVTTGTKSNDPLNAFPEVGETEHMTIMVSAFIDKDGSYDTRMTRR